MQHNPYSAPVTPGMGDQPLATGQYEFSQLEEQQIKQTGTRARIWGFISIALGVVICAFALIILVVGVALPGEMGVIIGGAALALGPMGLVYLGIGYFYITAGGRLAAVAETQGHDVEHLMQGLDKLANAFRIEAILTIAAFVLGIAIGAAGVVG